MADAFFIGVENKMHVKKILFPALILPLLLIGCATTGHLSTPTGRPEVFIKGVTKKETIDACVDLLVRNKWQIENTTDYIVQAVHASDNIPANYIWYSDFDMYRTWYRLIFTFAQESGGVRVFGLQQIVGNKGTSFEKILKLTTQEAYEGTQSYLQNLQNTLISSRSVSTDKTTRLFGDVSQGASSQ